MFCPNKQRSFEPFMCLGNMSNLYLCMRGQYVLFIFMHAWAICHIYIYACVGNTSYLYLCMHGQYVIFILMHAWTIRHIYINACVDVIFIFMHAWTIRHIYIYTCASRIVSYGLPKHFRHPLLQSEA